ncbi:MAG TPA: efflux RND transporter periplasmic adaptor subunit [Gemmatimonadales bacterium]|nr:efflux RND transporter periplasmic adaptor subunit [Gemmatimonadales bacterium]
MLTVRGQTVPVQTDWVGQAAASNSAQVRAQVSGIVIERPYVEGTDVKRGTVLYRIDPRTYAANYRSALAKLAQNRAQLANAQRTLNRLKPLLEARAAAQQDVDNAQAAYDEAAAAVRDAEAGVAAAKKSYEDTFVRATIDGRAGRAQVQLGALVSGPSDLLTIVDQVDPIYVYFNPSDQEVLQWRRDIAAKRLLVPKGMLSVQATLADGSVFADTGKINFVDVAFQTNTGALQLRAEFPNPRHTLLPGQYVRVHLLGIKRNGAILVPQRAVQQGLNGPFVYLLAEGNKPTARNVSATAWEGTRWLIDNGLEPGDKVIVDGTQKLAPGQPVRPVAYRPEADTTLGVRGDTVAVAPPSAAPPIRDTSSRAGGRP